MKWRHGKLLSVNTVSAWFWSFWIFYFHFFFNIRVLLVLEFRFFWMTEWQNIFWIVTFLGQSWVINLHTCGEVSWQIGSSTNCFSSSFFIYCIIYMYEYVHAIISEKLYMLLFFENHICGCLKVYFSHNYH